MLPRKSGTILVSVAVGIAVNWLLNKVWNWWMGGGPVPLEEPVADIAQRARNEVGPREIRFPEEAPAVERARNEVFPDRATLRVVPPCVLLLFKNGKKFSNVSDRFTVHADSITSYTHWSASQPCQLQYQRRSGEWFTLDKLQDASEERSVELPVTKIGSKLVDIIRFPPSNYSPASDSGSCTICLQNDADVQLIGNTPKTCGHLVLCWKCLHTLLTPLCPICRCEISAVSYNYRS